MELRIARVLLDQSAPWMNELSEAQALALSRAAIRAMWQPTEPMIAVAEDEEPGIGVPSIYSAMIDAASPPNAQ